MSFQMAVLLLKDGARPPVFFDKNLHNSCQLIKSHIVWQYSRGIGDFIALVQYKLDFSTMHLQPALDVFAIFAHFIECHDHKVTGSNVFQISKPLYKHIG